MLDSSKNGVSGNVQRDLRGKSYYYGGSSHYYDHYQFHDNDFDFGDFDWGSDDNDDFFNHDQAPRCNKDPYNDFLRALKLEELSYKEYYELKRVLRKRRREFEAEYGEDWRCDPLNEEPLIKAIC